MRDEFLKVHNLKADLDDFIKESFIPKGRESQKYFSLSPPHTYIESNKSSFI